MRPFIRSMAVGGPAFRRAVQVPAYHALIQVPLSPVVISVQFVGDASQQPDSIIVGGQAGQIKHLAEVAVPLVCPTLGDDYGFHHLGGGGPTLFGRLMQVASKESWTTILEPWAMCLRVFRSRVSRCLTKSTLH